MQPRLPESLLQRFFSGLAEYTFQTRLGIVDPPLVDYLAELLARFVRTESIYRLRGIAGNRLEEVAQMLAEADERQGDARREVHRHIGDFALFWAGVYPEALRKLRGPARLDHFVDYCQRGKRSYLIASSLSSGEQEPQGQVLERLSREFELCVYGLSEVRREWERHDEPGDGPTRLLID